MSTTKKAPVKKATPKGIQNKGKTELVLKMVGEGKDRKAILDALIKMDNSISRKSNAGLVSHIFKAHNLLGKVASGVERGAKKKVVTVKGSTTKKASTKKASTAKKATPKKKA